MADLVSYKPPWAGDHVAGTYTRMELDEDGVPLEQTVKAQCSKCGATFQRQCSSGAVKQHIARFSMVHLHRHPLNDPMPRRAAAATPQPSLTARNPRPAAPAK